MSCSSSRPMRTDTARSRSPRPRRARVSRVLGVATLHEGIQLRRAGCRLPIVVLSPLLPSEVDEAVAHDLEPTVCDLDVRARVLRASAARAAGRCAYHVEVDTGMGRTGVRVEDAESFLEDLLTLPGLASRERLHALPRRRRARTSSSRTTRCGDSARCSNGSHARGIHPPRLHAREQRRGRQPPRRSFRLAARRARSRTDTGPRTPSPDSTLLAGDVVQEPARAGPRHARRHVDQLRADLRDAPTDANGRRRGRLRARVLVAALESRHMLVRRRARADSRPRNDGSHDGGPHATCRRRRSATRSCCSAIRVTTRLSLDEVARGSETLPYEMMCTIGKRVTPHLRPRRAAGEAHHARRRERGLGASGRGSLPAARAGTGAARAAALSMRAFLIVLDGVGDRARCRTPATTATWAATRCATSRRRTAACDCRRSNRSGSVAWPSIAGVRAPRRLRAARSGAWPSARRQGQHDRPLGDGGRSYSSAPFPTYPHGFPDRVARSASREQRRTRLDRQRRRIGHRDHRSVSARSISEPASSSCTLRPTACSRSRRTRAPCRSRSSTRSAARARALLTGEHAVGRVIARPFTGTPGDYRRTTNRRDFSLRAARGDAARPAGRQPGSR